MRIYTTFVGTTYDASESVKGGFYLNAVSLGHANTKANKILALLNIETELLSLVNERSDDFKELPFYTFKGLNGIVKMVGNYTDDNAPFERSAIIKRGQYIADSDLLLSEVEALNYI